MHPGARVDHVGGVYAGALIVRVRARAVDGAANDAVATALATAFSVPRSALDCVRGHRSRRKFFHVEGEAAALEAIHQTLLAAI